jgi:hypothetical protein
MEVETVLSLTNKMKLFAEILTQKHQMVRSLAGNIDWSGDAREQFSADINSLINSVDKLTDNILILSRQLSKEIDQWVTADRTGSKKIQTVVPANDLTKLQKVIGTGRILKSWIVGLKDPPQLNEVWENLRETQTGKDLERLARENNICFILPNGDLIGDSNAVIQIPINFGKTIGGGSYNPSNGTITISDDKLQTGGLIGLTATLAHEMQHAIDYATGEGPFLLSFEGLSEAQIEARLEQYYDAKIHSEVRAYERTENILYSTSFIDDGVLTGEERNQILYHTLANGTYKSYYEGLVIGVFDGQYTATISVNPNTGELDVNLIPVGQPLSEFAYSA